MIDLTLLRENPESVVALLQKKEPSFPIQRLILLDSNVRSIRQEVETLRHIKNELANQAKSGLTPEIREKSINVGKELREKENQLKEVEEEFLQLYLQCPNIPDPSLPEGGKQANKVVKEFGEKPSFRFAPKNHVELGAQLGWFDFEAAATMAQSNFVLYKGQAVKLMYALTRYMLEHNESFGYSLILPPYLVNEKSLEIAGNFPKFREQVYQTSDNLYLIPTAEVSLANMYRNRIFASEELPIRLTSWTSCFRREAGTYGAHERGLIRIHEFEKVELYAYCQPEESDEELNKMVSCAETILQHLGLHYRISLLAMQDCSFQSARTYDIEVWMPGQNAYYEVSSCSNCTDFQSRRGSMRYKKNQTSKTHFVHTLNGSSLALPRLMVAIMETYQQEDGSIAIPEILKPYGMF